MNIITQGRTRMLVTVGEPPGPKPGGLRESVVWHDQYLDDQEKTTGNTRNPPTATSYYQTLPCSLSESPNAELRRLSWSEVEGERQGLLQKSHQTEP
jgi:hypothetical protein